MESNWTESVESFDDLGVKEELLRGIYGIFFKILYKKKSIILFLIQFIKKGYGYEKPSLI